MQVGDPTLAIGNPFGLDRTLTTGVVSALQRSITAPNGFTIDNVIQTDAPINPGNSGGPLLNAEGQVIGVNSQIETGGSGDGSVGIGFAVPINTAKSVIPQLEKSGKVQQAYLGLEALTDRRHAVGAEPAGVERRACADGAGGHARRQGRLQGRRRAGDGRRCANRARRRHHHRPSTARRSPPRMTWRT